MKRTTMQLLTTVANVIKPHLQKTYTAEQAVKLLDELKLTITPAELQYFPEAEDKLLFLLRALGVRINLQVKDIDWWYYNRYLNINDEEANHDNIQ